jgi:hypothetical protein
MKRVLVLAAALEAASGALWPAVVPPAGLTALVARAPTKDKEMKNIEG